VLLTLATNHEPATDLGFLLVKHPDRVHEFDLPHGTAYVCFPEATEQYCRAALIVEVDPARLGNPGRRGQPDGFGELASRTSGTGTLGKFVNDRPYAASSLLAAALNRAFRSAMRGECRERPELAQTPIALFVRIPALRCRGGAGLASRLLEPLGWHVQAAPAPLDPTRPEWGDSRYLDVTLSGTLRLADALNQLYVLLPVFDDAKHYWVAPDEVDKLIRAGGGWLAHHPERGLITRRYLAHSRALAGEASERLDALRVAESVADPDTVEGLAAPATDEEAELPAEVRRAPLAEQRRLAVLAELRDTGATRVLDLGCGSGALLADLARDKRLTDIVGVDISSQALAMAERRLKRELPRGRVSLLQSALTYADDRLVGFDAAVLMEVIEHIDPPRLPALAAAVFDHARPSTVIVTTPNVEYNVRYEGLTATSVTRSAPATPTQPPVKRSAPATPTQPPVTMRHHDHRFEWTRAEFTAWCVEVADRYGYAVRITGVGEADPELGCPTQLATFARPADRAIRHGTRGAA
jgi:3' terminal RNA ribose 2'-O-methyltransferase Hen1